MDVYSNSCSHNYENSILCAALTLDKLMQVLRCKLEFWIHTFNFRKINIFYINFSSKYILCISIYFHISLTLMKFIRFSFDILLIPGFLSRLGSFNLSVKTSFQILWRSDRQKFCPDVETSLYVFFSKLCLFQDSVRKYCQVLLINCLLSQKKEQGIQI